MLTLLGSKHSNRKSDPKSLNKAILACAQQIEFSPRAALAFKKDYNTETLPSHVGYEQMTIFKEKEKNYHEVVYYCTKAMEEGWRGNWKERVERCQNKLMKKKPKDLPIKI